MQLPKDPTELRRHLAEASGRFARAISEAERETEVRSLKGRAAVIDEYLVTLKTQSTRLHELNQKKRHREADDLVATLERERQAIDSRLAQLNAGPSTPQVAVAEPRHAEVARPPVVDPLPAAAPAKPLAPDDGTHAGPEATTPKAPVVPESPDASVPGSAIVQPNRQQPRDAVLDLYSAAQKLKAAAPQIDRVELELRVQQLVARTRQVQETWPTLKSAAGEQGRYVKQTFGILTRICAEYLNPQGVYIDTLRSSANAGWSAERWEEEEQRIGQELADWVHKRTESERREHEAATEFRRREQVRNQNARIHDELDKELDELLAEGEPDTESLIELVTELLAVRPLKRDSREPEPVRESMARKLAPHAALFRTGHDFKPLRHALRRAGVIGGDSARLPAVAPEVEDTEPRKTPDDEFRNWFAGRRAAIAGGSCREYRRERLQEYFGFAELEWIENERNETADGANLARRIRNGRYDIVFLLARFCSHDLQNHMKQACKESGVPFVLVERGYGRNQISAGLRSLGDRLPQKTPQPS